MKETQSAICSQVSVVIYSKPRCPRCGEKAPVYNSSARPIRYHKCRHCGFTFKSIEA